MGGRISIPLYNVDDAQCERMRNEERQDDERMRNELTKDEDEDDDEDDDDDEEEEGEEEEQPENLSKQSYQVNKCSFFMKVIIYLLGSR